MPRHGQWLMESCKIEIYEVWERVAEFGVDGHCFRKATARSRQPFESPRKTGIGGGCIAAITVPAVDPRINHHGLARGEIRSFRGTNHTAAESMAHDKRITLPSDSMWLLFGRDGNWSYEPVRNAIPCLGMS